MSFRRAGVSKAPAADRGKAIALDAPAGRVLRILLAGFFQAAA
jgi:hypothetical protein